jgi:hypothetical protein
MDNIIFCPTCHRFVGDKDKQWSGAKHAFATVVS